MTNTHRERFDRANAIRKKYGFPEKELHENVRFRNETRWWA